jgi:hypothetical protein
MIGIRRRQAMAGQGGGETAAAIQGSRGATPEISQTRQCLEPAP